MGGAAGHETILVRAGGGVAYAIYDVISNYE